MARRLHLTLVPGELAVCRLPADAPVPPWVPIEGFVSLTRTPEELSVVCDAAALPDDVERGGLRVERGWCRLRFEGPFAFTETGILLAVLGPLAEVGVGIFALSTFDTDHVLVPVIGVDTAVRALESAGHTVIR